MFDVGFTEVLVIGVIALMVVGPERLPKLARTAGFWVGRARRMVSDVKADIDREINKAELTSDFKEIKQTVSDAKSEIESATTDVANTINQNVKSAQADLDDVRSQVDSDQPTQTSVDSSVKTSADPAADITTGDVEKHTVEQASPASNQSGAEQIASSSNASSETASSETVLSENVLSENVGTSMGQSAAAAARATPAPETTPKPASSAGDVPNDTTTTPSN